MTLNFYQKTFRNFLHTTHYKLFLVYHVILGGGDRGVMVIVVENGHGDTSSNP